MKPIAISKHAKVQLKDRGTTANEVEQAIELGEQVEVKKVVLVLGRILFLKTIGKTNTMKPNKFWQLLLMNRFNTLS